MLGKFCQGGEGRKWEWKGKVKRKGRGEKGKETNGREARMEVREGVVAGDEGRKAKVGR